MLNEWLIVIVGVAGLLIGVTAVATWSYLREQKTQAQNLAAKRKEEIQQKLSHSERLREVYKLLTNLTATLSYQRVLDIALDLTMRALSSPDDLTDRLVSAVLLFKEEEGLEPYLHIEASRRFIRADLKETFPAHDGILKNTIDEGGPLTTQDIAQDPELGRIYTFQACGSAYCFPLRVGFESYGVLLYGHPDPQYFTAERCDVLDIIGNQAMIAIQNARLYQNLEKDKEHMIEIQEETRKKLARDLHDGPTQSVAAIAMRVNFARRLIERDTSAASDELYKIEDLARRTTKEIRHMLFTLRPLILESQGLTAALESMAEKMKETFDQKVTLDVNKEVEKKLEIGKQGILFTIVEEAVTNARKYAYADQIWVRLKTLQPDIAVLEIQDDGVGFDVSAVDASYESRGSLGLINMRDRSELVNGVFNIESAANKGTLVQVVIPLTEQATERLHRGV